MESSRESILKTLLYFDIFDYPLKEKEIWQFLGTSQKVKKETLNDLLKKLHIPFYKSFFFLKSRKNIVNKRIAREKISVRKLKKARKVINILGTLPMVYFVGISGALSMENCEDDDDIDIFVICKDNFVWTTRIFLIIILIFLGVYRRKNDKYFKDKICLNLIIAKRKMTYFKSRQSLYLAHEIIQLLPILDKNNTYKKFIEENKWVFDYLPNGLERIGGYNIPFDNKNTIFGNLSIKILKALRFEKLAKFLQLNYMKKDITIEKVNDNLLAFHPIDYGKKIMETYNKRKSRNIL